MRENQFQIEVATGRFTLPVVILICLLWWGITFHQANEFISLGIVAAISYLMIETNTSFSLIRTRTALPVCIYAWLATSLFFLHPYEGGNWAPLAFLLAIFHFFASYESSQALPTYHSFLFISLGSLAFPPLIYFIPLFFLSMFSFRSLCFKNFWASILGLLTPYWFLLAYALYFDRMPLLVQPFQEMVHFYPIDFSLIPTQEIVSAGIISLLLIIGSIHYWLVSYLDKTRTRIFLTFLTIVGIWTTVLEILQPVHIHTWIQLQLIPTAFLNGHLFTLTRNRFAGIYFMVTFITFIFLTLTNLWMQYFNF